MDIEQAIQNEFKLRVFDESYPRIEKCLNRLSQEQIWHVPNENTVSVGSLTRHLLGNMQQWVYAGVLGNSFQRDRDAEFESQINVPKETLLEEMETAKSLVLGALENLRVQHLSRNMEIQGIPTTGFSAMVHVMEHFSYHTGQIALLTKLMTNQDLGFYAELDL